MTSIESKLIIAEILNKDELFKDTNKTISLLTHSEVLKMIEIIDFEKGIGSQDAIICIDHKSNGMDMPDGFQYLKKLRTQRLIEQKHISKTTKNYLNYSQFKLINEGIKSLKHLFAKDDTSKTIILKEHYNGILKKQDVIIRANKNKPFKIPNDDTNFDHDSCNIIIDLNLLQEVAKAIKILNKKTIRKIIKLLLENEALSVNEIHKQLDDEKKKTNEVIEDYYHVTLNKATISAKLIELEKIGVVNSKRDVRIRYKSLLVDQCSKYFEFIKNLSVSISIK